VPLVPVGGRCGLLLSSDGVVLSYGSQRHGPAERAGVPLRCKICKVSGKRVRGKADIAARLAASHPPQQERLQRLQSCLTVTCELHWLSSNCQAFVFNQRSLPAEGRSDGHDGVAGGSLRITAGPYNDTVYMFEQRRRHAQSDNARQLFVLPFSLAESSSAAAAVAPTGTISAEAQLQQLQAQALSFIAGIADDLLDLADANRAVGFLQLPTTTALLGQIDSPKPEMRAALDVMRVLSLREVDCLRGYGREKIRSWLEEDGGGRLSTRFVQPRVRAMAATQPVRHLRQLCEEQSLRKDGDKLELTNRLIAHDAKVNSDLELRALERLRSMIDEEAKRLARNPVAGLPGGAAEMARRAELIAAWCDKATMRELNASYM
jgi:hypothetical protein